MTSITAERNGLASVGMRHRRRNEWGARRSYTDARSVTEPATRVFVHISVTNPSAYNSNDAHARALEAIGISRFPNTGISYNRGIMPNGAIYEFQPIGRRGAHTVNDFRRSTCSTTGCPSRGNSLSAPSWNLNINARAYVICQNVGHTVTDKMVDSVARAIAADKLAGFVAKSARVHGHRCVSAKSCPGDRMWARMGDVNRLANNYVANGLGGTTPPPPSGEDWDMPYRNWPSADKKALLDDIGTAVALQKNGTSGKTLSLHIRRGDLSEPRFTSKVSGNTISAATALMNAQEQATAARNELTRPLKSPVSGSDRSLRQIWSYTYRDINRGRAEVSALAAEVAGQSAQIAALTAVMQQVLDNSGAGVDMEAVAEASKNGAEAALADFQARIQVIVDQADEPDDDTPNPEPVTDPEETLDPDSE